LLGARAGGRATVPGSCVSRTGGRATLPAGCASRTGERGVCCGFWPGGVMDCVWMDCVWTTGPRAVATCARRPTAGHQPIAAATDAAIAIAIATTPASRGVRRRDVGSHKDQRRRNPADLDRRLPLLRPGACTTCVPGVALAVTGIKTLVGSGCAESGRPVSTGARGGGSSGRGASISNCETNSVNAVWSARRSASESSRSKRSSFIDQRACLY
jgi:hypothetical protein